LKKDEEAHHNRERLNQITRQKVLNTVEPFTFAGAGVKGGVLGAYPELKEAALFENRDMPVAHDFRDLFAAAISSQWGLKDFSKVFPAHAAKPTRGLFG
jgi:uncharacterized protein (DUF1501 family)